MTEWKKVYGSQAEKPSELDTTSSGYFVYQRKNIIRTRYTDNSTGSEYELWEYDERKLTKEEYARIREQELEDDLTQMQLALTELYESVVV